MSEASRSLLSLAGAVLLALAAAPSPAAAQAAPKALSCEGVFARDSSHARVVKAFGAGNVQYKKVEEEGGHFFASVAYLKDRKNWLQFQWTDAKARKGLSEVTIWGDTSPLKTPSGIGNGAPLAKVVEVNGKPISIQAFGTEVQGRVDFNGGALEKLPGGCGFGLYMQAGPGAPEAPPSLYGEQAIASTDPDMIAQKPVVGWMTIGWTQ